MEQYQVTGMSCAACSARVEKAVSKVPGVTSCSVSLLTGVPRAVLIRISDLIANDVVNARSPDAHGIF